MLIDMHAHFDYYSKDELKYALNMLEKNHVKAIAMSTGNNCHLTKELALKYPQLIIPAYGIYPANKEGDTIMWDDYKKVLGFIRKEKPKVIGEVGLDFTYNNIKEQEIIFLKVIELANEINAIMSIHTRKAEKRVLELLEEYSKAPLILHCFSGNMKLVKKAIELGYYFSIPTNILRSSHFKKMVELIPINQILLETDSPYLSSDRTMNFPHRIIESIEVISDIKKRSNEEVIKQIEHNQNKLLNLNKD